MIGDPPPPTLDRTRHRLRLPRHLLPTALLLVDRRRPLPASGTPGLASLEAAGIATGSGLHPIALRILTPVSAPRYVVSVDVFRNGLPTIATVWCSGRSATVGTSHDRRTFALDPVEPGFIPFHLAALAGVGPRPAGPGRAPTGIDVRSGGGGEPTVEAAGIRWRISTLWRDPDGFVGDRSIEVIDAGPRGYWEVTTMPGSTPVLTPRNLDSVLRLIGDAVAR